MNFVSIRVISADVARLAGFYEQLLGVPVQWTNDDFAQLVTGTATLAMGSTRTVGPFARPASNGSVIIEFLVDDPDEIFHKLPEGVEVVQEPTTMPWGNRSLLVRDPDGTVVNLFSRP
ncbi:VOC family protein [Actinoplanes sp. N902-109]|uniref:VOC family protein n=1 Tax=Actinoplanes sp. (strain N902-109) TaxID=649831 RepID=UPI0005A01B0E|nr:VOC family protein [Actinoplanes sp. N902-109]